MSSRTIVLAAAILGLGLAACEVSVGPATVVQGSGNVKSETRDVHGFDRVALTGVGTLSITQGSTEGLTIQTDDNLLPHLRSDVEGTTLRLGPRSGVEVRPTKTLHYDLQVKQIRGLEVAGAADVQAASLNASQLDLTFTGASQADLGQVNADALTVVISGSGEVTVAGRAARQTVTISGAGKYMASGLAGQQATVTVTGAGDCAVRVSDHLAVTITGAGNVSYYGSPSVDEHVTGAGSVTRAGA